MIGEASLDLYETLKKHNGDINLLKLTLDLKFPQQNIQKSILSSRLQSFLYVSLADLNVDMTKFPQKESNRLNNLNTASNSLAENQPTTSAASETQNAVSEITSSLPKWSLNDPFSSGTSNGTNGQNISKNTSPSRNNSSVNTSNHITSTQPSTSSANSGQPSRPSVPAVEEQLPTGWEIRYDTYGR